MYPSVAKAFSPFSIKFEGYLPFMYLDIKGYVTTGMGNLVDPIGAALSLPWRRPDASLAAQGEISDAWHAVDAQRCCPKGQQQTSGLATKYGQAFGPITTIRLDKAGIDTLIQQRLATNEAFLRKKYPGYDHWPADAQMGIHSMSWAMGPGFNFPQFTKAVNQLRPDFAAAAIASHINEKGNPGIVPRNAANLQLFNNAEAVLKLHADPSKLFYPGPVVGTDYKKIGLIAAIAGTVIGGAILIWKKVAG